MTAIPSPAGEVGERRALGGFWRQLTESVLSPASGLRVFSVVLLLVYGVVPLVVYEWILPGEKFVLLAQITCVGVVGMWLGASIPLFDQRFRIDAIRVRVDGRLIVFLTSAFFALFVVVTFATAPSIPILSALRGIDPELLSQQRGEFLKGRQGPALALLYISTLLVNTLLPYVAVLLYSRRSRYRHWFAGAFLLFSVSFMAKSLFLNLILPLVAYFASARRLGGKAALVAIGGSVLLLLAGVALSFGSPAGAGSAAATPADMLTAQFAPTSPVQYFLWRAFAVPIFTATDTLVVHADYFDGRALLGATSSLLSSVFGLERVNLERIVFEYQFGGWNDTANSNALFLVDAYVNFSWLGVLVFGAVAGQIFRWFRRSKDVAFASLWPLFAFVLFNASMIGMMLSNGFLLMLMIALFVRVAPSRSSTELVAT